MQAALREREQAEIVLGQDMNRLNLGSGRFAIDITQARHPDNEKPESSSSVSYQNLGFFALFDPGQRRSSDMFSHINNGVSRT
ncbi:hypothetical protein F2Q70_00043795 [Brassica cretica]|uniref:Uncharacterized protein n=1 Tax=Brassica cretica TaxID=69181 RepID=A0A8S9KJ70_BRACR|nr:hypothetical protein F2Q70_00043795 [Brassica cretica]